MDFNGSSINAYTSDGESVGAYKLAKKWANIFIEYIIENGEELAEEVID